MDNAHLGLFGLLFFLLVLISAFFSGTETALMSLNRYRLRHLAESGHPGAIRAQRLLSKPDRLIGLILLGNNLTNILITQLATYVGYALFGDAGIAIATGGLTFGLLIFAEVAPKTLAALHAERVAFPASYIYVPMLAVVYPLVWLVNLIANSILRLVGVSPDDVEATPMSREELRSVVNQAGGLIPRRHQKMLLGLLDLDKTSVEDIMVPRNEIVGIDLDEPWDEIIEQLEHTSYTRLPVYHGDIDRIAGIVHIRHVFKLAQSDRLDKETLEAELRAPYFIPESTTLNQQLLNFQSERRRIGLVVDEYGDIQGLVTLEDLLEEVVGEFTTDPTAHSRDIHPQSDGSYMIDGSIHIRELNRALGWRLPTRGPRTLNGLILEHLEMIPEPGTSVLISGYPLEIVQTKNNAVRTVRAQPRLPQYRQAR
ncbi:HlyC/CorC family transporter [Acidihalobacter ferrooxydans]|uniref:Magnesium and cobalt efflux protein CorC n=1 Tax=Acidihalobacter ferrooxydans TaxID=1765967 RepID=A0A1P8UJD6_9GAMM|nr:HlyC/CorC family transporter [Acidihalobacter ferrooxydans]APZ43891.1 magnesium/cobalt efflux protein [Acidihalobacter ferrooxydans]